MEFLDLIGSVLRSYPGILLNPVTLVLYVVVTGLILSQYSRVEDLEEQLYGIRGKGYVYETLASMGFGLLGGAIASVGLVLIGVSISDSGIGYLMPLALFLFLFSPRFLCYSYAGGLACISFLLFGWPKVDVPAIMALVACLHAAEALLITMSGHRAATPLYIQDARGQTVGGFSLQRFWPIPLMVLFMVRVPDISTMQGVIHLPDWWPLIKGGSAPGVGMPVYGMAPIIAALGYGDIAVKSTPKKKAEKTAGTLFLYSAFLFLFAVLASRYRAFAWVAAVYSPLAHEIIVKVGSKEELLGPSLYESKGRGVVVLDVVYKSQAHFAGLRSEDVIIAAGGFSVKDREDLFRALSKPGDILFTVIRSGSKEEILARRPKGSSGTFGIITAPEFGDRPMVKPQSDGVLGRALKNLLKGALR